LGAYEEALDPCNKVLASDPRHADALNTRGVVLTKLRRCAEALASYDAALAVAPDRVDIEINRGTVLLELDRFDEALASFDKALTRDPDNVTALVNRGNACIKDKRFAEALQNYDSALALAPDQVGALNDRCVALAEMDRCDEALAAADQALRVGPHVVAAHVNRGNALMKLARLDEALVSYGEALKLDPEQVDANFNASLAKLCLADFSAGWEQYEYRWKKKEFQRREYARPMWRGERDIAGKTVLLVHEQGLGDTIQFVRYAPLVADLGARVLVGVQPPLKSVVATVPGIAQIIADGEVLPEFDLFCPMLNLPRAFGTELATIPAKIPYIRPYQERLEKWRDRFVDDDRVRVGICWAGNTAHLNDRNRSIALPRLAKVLSVPGIDFVSIQKDVGEAQADVLRAHGVRQLGQEFADFSDTAAVIALLDLVVAVDTSVAHLAGAMGKAVALLIPFSPDWRWLLDRTDSPWYTTIRIFRQDAVGDWDGPLERLHRELSGVARRGARRR
jgi:tetratricopeptide (TPR) repeat protein